MTENPESAAPPWETLVCAGHFPSLAEANEHGLVVLAMGEACWVTEDSESGGFVLYVDADVAVAAGTEIAAYDQDQHVSHLHRRDEPLAFPFPSAWSATTLWSALLCGVFILESEDPFLVGRAACSNIDLIRYGEWWRPFTSLLIHADFPHLLGNLLSGALFGSLAGRLLGPWRAWILIVIAGTLGNTLSAALTYPEPFTSLGASTAVFAALGLLSGIGVRSLSKRHLPWPRLSAPLVGGLALLGWLGGASPNAQIDVLGHVNGFLCGLIIGWLSGGRLNLATADASIAETATAGHDAAP